MSTKKKSHYSFFSSKKRKQSKSPSPSDSGGRSNAPKKLQVDFDETEANDLLKDDEDMNISGENLDPEIVEKIANNQKGTTYAGAAEKKKVDNTFLIYLQKGHERREPITKGLFLTFMSNLQSKPLAIQNSPKLSEGLSLVYRRLRGFNVLYPNILSI